MFLSILGNQEKEDFLNLVINVAEADGDFTDKEKNQIGAYILEMGLDLKEREEYNKSIEDLLQNFSSSTKEVKNAVFIEIVALMLVDGLKEEEKILLNQMRDKFSINSKFQDDAINWYSDMLPLYKKGFDLVGIGGVL